MPAVPFSMPLIPRWWCFWTTTTHQPQWPCACPLPLFQLKFHLHCMSVEHNTYSNITGEFYLRLTRANCRNGVFPPIEAGCSSFYFLFAALAERALLIMNEFMTCMNSLYLTFDIVYEFSYYMNSFIVICNYFCLLLLNSIITLIHLFSDSYSWIHILFEFI